MKLFTKEDFKIILNISDNESLVKKFLKSLNDPTFGMKITKAMIQREQGQFNQAMLNMAEVNRDQVLAIREIQLLIDNARGRELKGIVFQKYRQFYPFQIGLTDGEEVLELLSHVKVGYGEDFSKVVDNIHDLEKYIESSSEELEFIETRMRDRIPQSEIDNLRTTILNNETKLYEIKKVLIDKLITLVGNFYSYISAEDHVKIVRDVYLILTSSIETLDAKFVDVEKD